MLIAQACALDCGLVWCSKIVAHPVERALQQFWLMDVGWLAELPGCFLHIGSTPRSLEDIREFNVHQSLLHRHYLLNENDCR